MLRKIIFSVAALLTVGVASAQVKFQSVSTDDLRKLAVAEGKLVFIDLYASWCPPCRTMESEVFSREDVGEFMSARFICAKYDIDKTMGKELASEYGVRSIPTYLIFDTEGTLLGRMQGAMPASEFMDNIESGLNKE